MTYRELANKIMTELTETEQNLEVLVGCNDGIEYQVEHSDGTLGNWMSDQLSTARFDRGAANYPMILTDEYTEGTDLDMQLFPNCYKKNEQ